MDTLTDSYFWYTILAFIGVFIVAMLLGESQIADKIMDKVEFWFKGK